jgi:hypothetical protein
VTNQFRRQRGIRDGTVFVGVAHDVDPGESRPAGAWIETSLLPLICRLSIQDRQTYLRLSGRPTGGRPAPESGSVRESVRTGLALWCPKQPRCDG